MNKKDAKNCQKKIVKKLAKIGGDTIFVRKIHHEPVTSRPRNN